MQEYQRFLNDQLNHPEKEHIFWINQHRIKIIRNPSGHYSGFISKNNLNEDKIDYIRIMYDQFLIENEEWIGIVKISENDFIPETYKIHCYFNNPPENISLNNYIIIHDASYNDGKIYKTFEDMTHHLINMLN